MAASLSSAFIAIPALGPSIRARDSSPWPRRQLYPGEIRRSAPDDVGSAPVQRALVGRPGVDSIEKRHRLGMTILKSAARGRGFQWKAHLDVGGREFVAGKPVALAEFAFPECHVLLQLRIDQ